MKPFISKTTNFLYERVFREKTPQGAWVFTKNLGYIAIGFGFSAFCIFAFQIMGGRILGPQEYGKYGLVDSTALFLQVFMLFGLSLAAIKYSVGEKDFQRQRRIISTSFWLVLCFCGVFALLFFLFTPQLSRIFFVPPLLFRLSIVFAFSFAFYTLSTDTLRGLLEMKKLAFFRAGYGFLALTLFSCFLLQKYVSFESAVFSICLAFLITFALIAVKVRQYFSFQFDWSLAKKIVSYGFFITAGGMSLVFLPAFNRLIVNRFLTITDVGVYSAYYLSSIGIVLVFSKIFTTVFFPTASQYEQKGPIFERIRKLLPYLFLVGTPVFFGIEWLILILYGKEYPIDYCLLFLFAFCSILIFVYGLYNWLFCSKGILGVKIAALVSLIVIATNVFFSVYLIPSLSLFGAIIAVGTAYLGGITCLLSLKKRIL